MPWITEPESEYFTSQSWGSSDARKALISPRCAMDYRTGVAKATSSGFAMGTAWDIFHTGDATSLAIRPADLDGRTKEGKAWASENAGKVTVTHEEWETIKRMGERMPFNCIEATATARANKQCQLVGRTDMDGVSVQCRVDLLSGGVLYDLKTTSKPIEQFAKAAFGYGYHVQAGWYRMVAHAITGKDWPFRFIVTETVAPWRTVEFIPDSDFTAYGDAKAREALAIIAECTRKNEWPETISPTCTLTLPKWAKTGGDQPAFED
jgi:hypothetical protein